MTQIDAAPARSSGNHTAPARGDRVRNGEPVDGLYSPTVSAHDLHLDLHYHEVIRGDRQIELTRLEFRLLYLLAHNVNQVVTYAELIAFGWGYTDIPDPTDLLKSPISRLRTKVNLRPPGRLGIVAVSRRGYMLTLT